MNVVSSVTDGARRAAAKKIHRAALAHEMHAGFPRFRPSDRFNHRVKIRLRRLANFRGQIPAFADVNRLARAQPPRRFQPRRAPPGHRHVAAEILGQRDEHQANRSRADDEHILAGAQFGVVHALHDARQRLGERGVGKIRLRLEPQEIFLDEPRGHDDGFGVGAVEEL